MTSIVFFLTGLLLGAISIWFIRKYKFESEKGVSLSEFNLLQTKLTELNTSKTISEKQLNEVKSELNQEREKSLHLTTKLSEMTANYNNLQEKLAAQKQELEDMQKKLTTEFENLANKILDEKTTKFTKQNQDNLDVLLKPFNEKLNEFKKKVEDTYSNESKERATLQGEIKQLFELNQTMAKEAKNLTTALKGGSKTQGNWGELILEKILERSGLQKGIEFTTQESFHSEDGKRKHPDIILNLPENKHMIIDSKVSLTAYEQFFSTENESEKDSFLKNHVTSVRTHMRQLSDKNYQSLYQINSPDFVLMFMPIEPAFGLAVQHDPSLFYDAFDKNVVIVSPSTLLVTLQIISNIWKQERQNKHAIEIARQGGALYDKFVSFLDDLEKLGRQLKTASDTYDASMNKLSTGKGNLIGRTEKIKELGAKASKSISDKYLDTDTRLIEQTMSSQGQMSSNKNFNSSSEGSIS